jgi:glycosyltransferase involved in cell wall biosynthesis
MHVFALLFFALIAGFWIFHGLGVAYGLTRLPWVKNFAPAHDTNCPRISLLFAARDEEEKLPGALATLAAIDYPHLEIVAVNDRSKDSTGNILEKFAAGHSRLRVVHVADLPAGWLGKPHALQKAYEISTGEWLVFTDADVRFRADVLRRCVNIVKNKGLDHLTLYGDVDMHGFWEKVLLTFFGMAFQLATDPYRASDPTSRLYSGVGAFQMLRRTAYEASGTHRRLAMEVIDDMKLGKIVKESGFRSGVGIAQDAVSVQWHSGLGNLIRGVTKNFYACTGYNLTLSLLAVFAMLSFHIAPLAGIVWGHGWVRVFCAIAILIPLIFHAAVSHVMRVSVFYALTYPVGVILFCYMLLRSAFVTIKQGGIIWRDTFYSLKDLKRGSS